MANKGRTEGGHCLRGREKKGGPAHESKSQGTCRGAQGLGPEVKSRSEEKGQGLLEKRPSFTFRVKGKGTKKSLSSSRKRLPAQGTTADDKLARSAGRESRGRVSSLDKKKDGECENHLVKGKTETLSIRASVRRRKAGGNRVLQDENQRSLLKG